MKGKRQFSETYLSFKPRFEELKVGKRAAITVLKQDVAALIMKRNDINNQLKQLRERERSVIREKFGPTATKALRTERKEAIRLARINKGLSKEEIALKALRRETKQARKEYRTTVIKVPRTKKGKPTKEQSRENYIARKMAQHQIEREAIKRQTGVDIGAYHYKERKKKL